MPDVTEEITSTEVVNVTSEVKEEEDLGFKVFVGNLSFQTQEDELAEFFSNVGKVLKANIITRGTRSLGYGFVAFETIEEAEKATQELNKKELGGRDINVELAKPKEPSAAREGAPRSRRGRGPRGPRGGEDRTGTPSPRRFSNRRRGPQGEDSEEKKEDRVDGEATSGEAGEDAHRGGGRRNRGRGGRRGSRGGRGRGGRPRSGSRRHSSTGGRNPAGEGHEPGEPSKTTVFVANLPFVTDDEGLKELFKDYNIKSAHVVKRRSGRSKGFGFVDLVDETEQQKVLEGMKNVVSEGRELVIKIALSEPHVFVDEEKNVEATAVVEPTD